MLGLTALSLSLSLSLSVSLSLLTIFLSPVGFIGCLFLSFLSLISVLSFNCADRLFSSLSVSVSLSLCPSLLVL